MDQILADLNLTSFLKKNITEMTYTVKSTGDMVVFKGLDDLQRIKSTTFPTGVLTDIVIEEASEISQRDFDELMIRMRGQTRNNIKFQITLLLNPIHVEHWIKREFFDLRTYQKSHKVFILHSTYKDNEFIDEDYAATLEGYKFRDLQFYKVYCLGEWGRYGNLAFTNWTALACPYEEKDLDSIYIGMDFGFNHPFVIEKIGFKDGIAYSYDELCVKEKTNMEVIELNKELEILKQDERCTADSAEPARIKEWVQQGFSVVGAKKGKDSVSRGTDYLRSLQWHIDPDKCPRLLQEVQVAHCELDANDEPTDKLVEIMDDGIKALFYALEDLSRARGKPSILSGSKSDHKKALIDARKAERKRYREVVKAQRKRQKEEEKKRLTGLVK
jgi:phage terminase large subunit